MPITLDRPFRVLTQDEFGEIDFEVLGHAFAIHKELGRFFDEHVYRNALRARLRDRAAIEVFVQVEHRDFRKPYRLIDGGAVFELKTVQQLHEQHRGQVIHYLMLTGLRHAKAINFRPEQVEHEFVNCSITMDERRQFHTAIDAWDSSAPDCRSFQEALLELVADWGTGLDVHLYEEAMVHHFGGLDRIERDVDVTHGGLIIGRQKVHLIDPVTAFKLTTLPRDFASYESHLKRFVDNTSLERILWANISAGEVVFRVIHKTP